MALATIAWASAAASAIGAITTATAQSNAASYNAQIAQQNQLAAQQQGEAAVAQQQRVAEQRTGAALAAYGAGGVMASNGSPLDVLGDSARQATLDKLNTQYSYNTKALGYQDEANLQNSGAANAMIGGLFDSTASVLKGYGASQYYGKNPTSSTSKPNFYGGYSFVPGLGD